MKNVVAINEVLLAYRFQFSAALIFLVVFLRLLLGDFDPTFFVVAGEEFLNNDETPISVVVNEGPGYDGQFFFAYSLEPFSNQSEIEGVTIDYPSYRHQRIVYPLLSWILAMGYPPLIPFTMILVNALALFGLVYLFSLLSKEAGKSHWNAFLPLLICGLWMSLSRDLSESLEGFFVVASFYSFYKKKVLLFATSASLAILTREPSLLLLFFIALIWGVKVLFSKENSVLQKVKGSVGLAFPFLVFLIWKIYLLQVHAEESLISGGGNFALPFEGIYHGLKHNFEQIHDTKTLIEFVFWLGLFSWNVYLIVLGGRSLKFSFNSHFFTSALSFSWIAASAFAVTYAVAIFIDDWAFARVMASYNLLSFLLILFSGKQRLPKPFIGFSLLLLLLTLGRLIMRV